VTRFPALRVLWAAMLGGGEVEMVGLRFNLQPGEAPAMTVTLAPTTRASLVSAVDVTTCVHGRPGGHLCPHCLGVNR